MNDKTPVPVSSGKQPARRLRMIALVVLTLGAVSAGLVYWLETRSPDLSDNPAMSGFDRAQTRQMEQLYGTSGELIQNWINDLKQPGTQAFVIILASGLIAAGCFYFARLLDDDEKMR